MLTPWDACDSIYTLVPQAEHKLLATLPCRQTKFCVQNISCLYACTKTSTICQLMCCNKLRGCWCAHRKFWASATVKLPLPQYSSSRSVSQLTVASRAHVSICWHIPAYQHHEVNTTVSHKAAVRPYAFTNTKLAVHCNVGSRKTQDIHFLKTATGAG